MATGRPPGDSRVDASAIAGGLLGLISGPVAKLWQSIPRRAQHVLLVAALVLVVYPLVSFVAVIYLIDYLPNKIRVPLQERALRSWGLEREYSTTMQLDRMNTAVDIATRMPTLPSDQPSDDDYLQVVMPGQRVELRAMLKRIPKASNNSQCADAGVPHQNTAIGSFSFNFDDATWHKEGPVTVRERLHTVIILEENEWNGIPENIRQHGPVQLAISYTPNQNLTGRYFDCFRYEITPYLAVYKPSLRPIAASGTG